MIEDVKESLKQEIIKLYKDGLNLEDISNKLRVSSIDVNTVLNDNRDQIINEINAGNS